jgi:acetyl esterase/lipase
MGELTRRAFGISAGGGLLAVASGAPVLAMPAAGPQAFDPTPFVHPELRSSVPAILKLSQGPLTTEMLQAGRKAMAVKEPLLQPAWAERLIPGSRGGPDVKVYVINTQSGGSPRPAILHMHGGGFVLGDAKSAVPDLQAIASELECCIVTVEYRLAPETRFPGALEDNYAALKWLYANADQLGVDQKRIGVMGESAGGGHAAMLAIAARDRGEIPLAYQALIYPMLDDRTGSTRVAPPQQGALVWTPERNRFGWSSLLGVPAGSPRVPYGAVPSRIENLRGLPAAFIGVGSIDLFVDEDIDYARRLINSGVMADLNVVPGGFHGFDAVPGRKVGKQFRAALLAALAQGLQVQS